MGMVSEFYRRHPFALAWLILMIFAAAALALREWTGLHFTDAATPLGAACLIGLVALAYGMSGRSAILSNMAHWAVIWVLFSLVAGICTYATAALGGATHDPDFVSLDARLGFSWPAWYGFVTSHPALQFALALAYTSLMPQIVFSILYLGLINRNDRNAAFFFVAAIAFAITLAISWRFPALGALPYFGHAAEARPYYFADLEALRGHHAAIFSLMALKGLITLPSFHTVLALLFVYIHRGPTWIFRVIAVLNLAVLVSIPVGGGHYLSDMIAGAGVLALAIAIVRYCEGPVRPCSAGQNEAPREAAGDQTSSSSPSR